MGQTLSYTTFTDAGWNVLHLLSLRAGPTALPGIVSFEIGGGLLGQILAVVTVPADAAGFVDLQVPMPTGLMTPFVLHWECLTYDPSIPLGLQAPIETSNLQSVITF